MTAQVWLVAPEIERFVVTVLPGEAPPASAEVERVWTRMRGENPRLFGGGIYSVKDVNAERGEITAQRDSYQRLVVQPEVQTEVTQLSVSALAISKDERGRHCVLLGRRGERTRIHGGMWQICPAGGLDAEGDAAAGGVLQHEAIVGQLWREFAEEVGMELAEQEARPLAVVHDAVARSYDLVLRVEIEAVPRPRPGRGSAWEHQEIRWVAVEELAPFVRRERVIDSTRGLFEALGWV